MKRYVCDLVLKIQAHWTSVQALCMNRRMKIVPNKSNVLTPAPFPGWNVRSLAASQATYDINIYHSHVHDLIFLAACIWDVFELESEEALQASDPCSSLCCSIYKRDTAGCF